MNKVELIGNITKDLELKQTTSGKSVTSFSIGVSRQYAGQNGERESDFFNIVVWGKQAESCCKFLAKGNKVAVTGSLQNRTYDDKDGNKRYVTEIVADNVEFLTPKNSSNQPTTDDYTVLDEQLPF